MVMGKCYACDERQWVNVLMTGFAISVVVGVWMLMNRYE